MEDEGGSENNLQYRWGHSEGITAIVCVGDEGNERLVTCGADSDLRVWKSFDDEDPTAYELSDNGLTLVCGKNGEVFVGTEYNTVEAISLEDGKNLGVKAKFTASVNHVDLSTDGKWLVAGSGDMTIQLINLEDSSIQPVPIDTHSAPVLSVALDPLEEFLASSGCDGNVCIWSLTEEGKPVHMVKKLEGVFPPSNDITTSSTLCRMAWEKNGKILAVPEEDHIALYARDSWAKLKVLRSKMSKKIASVAKFSECGTYLAAGGSDGTLTVWRVSDSEILAEGAQFSDQVTGIVFANKGSDILAADTKGRVLLLKDFKTQTATKPGLDSKPKESSKSNEDAVDKDSDDDKPIISSQPDNSEPNDVFDDGMDDLFTDDVENEFSISKIKAETGFIGEEYVGVDKAKVIIGGDLRRDNDKNKSDDDDDDVRSVSSSVSRPFSSRKPTARPIIKNPVTEPQDPFQPASTPVNLGHRFMLWNNTGIIRTYEHEDVKGHPANAIDIDFHDAAVHHAIHMVNDKDYTLAALTKEMAVFANNAQSETGSILYCRTFVSWDAKKDWTIEFPDGENIVGLAAGDGWIAACTDMNRIRIFTSGGVQKQLIDVGGQIIAASGHEELLFVAFHNGVGINGNQSIAYSIFRIKPSLKPFPLVPCEPLPITPKSQISWIGFTDEGTPVCSDSESVLRILYGRYWTTYCALKEQRYADSTDHFWVVGVSELDQKIRCVKCKGMNYPQTLPRPQLMMVDAQTPLCEMYTEKSQLEDKFHLSLMLDALSKKMDKKNYEVDDHKSKAERDLKESLMKLFSMSCTGNWDARGAEYVSMMPSAHSVQIAVKLASKLRKKALVDRLTAIGRRKLDEEDLEDEGDDDDFETMKMGNVIYSHVQNRSLAQDYSASQDLFPEASSNRFSTSSASFSNSFSTGNRSVITIPDEENPFMKKNTEDIRKALLGPGESSINRFRKDKSAITPTENGECGKGLSAIDSWKKPTEKPADLFAKTSTRNSKGGGKKGGSEKAKEQAANKEKKKQTTLFDLGGRKKIRHSSGGGNTSNPASPATAIMSEESNDALIENEGSEAHEHLAPNSESLLEDSTNLRHPDKPVEEQPQRPKGKTGYLLWFDENREALEEEHPELGVKELTKIGTQMYKKLSPEEKKRYTNPTTDAPKDNKKRKISEVEECESTKTSSEGEKKSKLTSKLAAFACSTAD